MRITQVRLERIQLGCSYTVSVFYFETSSQFCVHTRFHRCLFYFVLFIYSFWHAFFVFLLPFPFHPSFLPLFSQVKRRRGGEKNGRRKRRQVPVSSKAALLLVSVWRSSPSLCRLTAIAALQSPHVKVESNWIDEWIIFDCYYFFF